jgi:hypothetical protein
MPYIGRDLNRGNYLKLDDISSSFNGSTQTFNLTVGGSAFTPGSAFSILVSVGGVIQEPESAYQVNNSEITFANAPTAQDGFFCIALAVPIGIGVPGNGTVNGTQMAKPFNYDGYFYLDDANNRVGIGSLQPTVTLDVDGVIKASSFTGGSGGINAGVGTFTGLDVNGNGDISGNLVLGGDLTVNGTTTTLDTNLIGVDRVEVGANSSTIAGIAVTQSGTADLVRLYDGTSQVVTIDDEGNVGLGTDAPTRELTLYSPDSGSTYINLTNATTGGGQDQGFLLGLGGDEAARILQQSNANMELATNATTRILIKNTGEVGINTTDASNQLTVFAKSGSSVIARFKAFNGNSNFDIHTDASSHGQAYVRNNIGVTKVALDSNGASYFTGGDVGIGTITPFTSGAHSGTHQLTVADNAPSMSLGASNTDQLYIRRELANGKFTFQTVQSGGNNGVISLQPYGGSVGIGSETPAQKLDVVGNSIFRGEVAISSGNEIKLSNNANTASATIDCDGGARLHLKSYSQSVATFEEGVGTIFYQGSSTNRLQIEPTGGVVVGAGGTIKIPDKMMHVGDEDTYLQFTDNVINLHSGGTTGLSVQDSSVRVPTKLGINGAAPQTPLDVIANGSGYAMAIRGRSSDNTAELRFTSNDYGSLYGTIIGGPTYLKFATSGTNRWQMDSSGHLLPETAGAVNIGSATAEIGNVYIADDKKVFLGSDQDFTLHHNNAHAIVKNTTGRLYVLSDDLWFKNQADNSTTARFLNGDTSIFYFAGNEKLRTSATGATVIGEVAATQDYPMVKPTLDCNFVLNKKLDPRIGYTRKGVASFYDEQGILKIVGDNVPRFDHNPETRESLGILIEEERTNLQPHSEQWTPDGADGWVNIASGMDVDYDPGVVTPTGETTGAITIMEAGASGQHYIAPDTFSATSGTTYTFSFFFKNISGNDANNLKFISSTSAFSYVIRTFYFSGSDIGTTNSPSDSTITKLPNGWWRGTVTLTANNTSNSSCHFDMARGLGSGAAYNNKIALWGYQVEAGAFPTSYIRTGNSDYGRTATRGVDFLQIQGQAFTDLYNPVESTILCSYQHTKKATGGSLGSSRRVYRFGTGATSSDTRIDFVSTSTFHPYIARDNSQVASLTATAPSLTDVNTYAVRVKQDDFAVTKAGAAISGNAQDTTGDWDPSNKMIEVQIGGTLNAASDASVQAHFKRFTYYPVGLPNSQLITISS